MNFFSIVFRINLGELTEQEQGKIQQHLGEAQLGLGILVHRWDPDERVAQVKAPQTTTLQMVKTVLEPKMKKVTSKQYIKIKKGCH